MFSHPPIGYGSMGQNLNGFHTKQVLGPSVLWVGGPSLKDFGALPWRCDMHHLLWECRGRHMRMYPQSPHPPFKFYAILKRKFNVFLVFSLPALFFQVADAERDPSEENQ